MKKGVFFTFAAIFFIIVILSISTLRENYMYREKSTTVTSRIKTMNNFIDDFEKDMDRELYIGGYRALISVNSYLRQIQGYVPELDDVFFEILANGTANGTQMDIMVQDGQGADIQSWLSRINEESSKINIGVSLDIKDIKITQTSPWNVTIFFNSTINISDAKNLASWTFNKEYTTEFPVLGFEDPLFVVATSDRMTNIINTTPYAFFVNDTTGDPENLYEHLKKSYYIESEEAPSFLMRFSGNLSQSPFGIESLVDLDEYYGQFGNYKARSVVDFIYFGNQTTTNYCNVTGMPEWFRIDDDHLDTYEINELNKTGC